ncbi:DUF1707 SHOCT-like domain-containing protein [Nocardioides zhouii]|uniref:DUF1707 domain-containing protein n=1 Tax=Nocardioides zhouii TaxID=1168729 RepID=A0A4Q2T2R6_9ACTN|nr:DUF1707 domain-containing protein [Nocardioides zhouii]RYC11280.1 DUF1707 domain-containing protein [Nocardioides zhouii]
MSPSDPQTRIADSDRERAMSDLAGHYADGRLDHEEYDERLDAIWTARTRADLAVIFSDLPRPQVTYPSPPARSASRSQRRRHFPLLPVIAVLVVLSVLTHAPFWLLIFPLMFIGSRRGMGCAPSHGHSHGQGDYRRPGRTHGV